MKNDITTSEFLSYLESLNLFRWNVCKRLDGITAVIAKDCAPKLKNFTQVKKQKDGTWFVRLSTKDFFNHAITNGFFN